MTLENKNQVIEPKIIWYKNPELYILIAVFIIFAVFIFIARYLRNILYFEIGLFIFIAYLVIYGMYRFRRGFWNIGFILGLSLLISLCIGVFHDHVNTLSPSFVSALAAISSLLAFKDFFEAIKVSEKVDKVSLTIINIIEGILIVGFITAALYYLAYNKSLNLGRQSTDYITYYILAVLAITYGYRLKKK